MIEEKIKKNKVCLAKLERNKGFAILFAVMISSVILAVTLSVGNILLKEIKFGTSAKDTNSAFFAADIGIECALTNDKSSSKSFVETGGSGKVTCLGRNVSLTTNNYPNFAFTLSGLGTDGKACAKVTVDKSSTASIVVSKGYNDGGDIANLCTQGPNSIERELYVSF